MLALPLALGCVFSGYIMDTFGRKLGQIMSCIPFTIGFVVLAFAPNVPGKFCHAEFSLKEILSISRF